MPDDSRQQFCEWPHCDSHETQVAEITHIKELATDVMVKVDRLLERVAASGGRQSTWDKVLPLVLTALGCFSLFNLGYAIACRSEVDARLTTMVSESIQRDQDVALRLITDITRIESDVHLLEKTDNKLESKINQVLINLSHLMKARGLTYYDPDSGATLRQEGINGS